MKKLLFIMSIALCGCVQPKPKEEPISDKIDRLTDSIAAADAAENAANEASGFEQGIEIVKHNQKSDGYGNDYVYVRVKNHSQDLVSYLDIKVVYSDKEGNIVGQGIGNCSNLASGATKTITSLAVGVENATEYNIEIGSVIR